MTNAIINVPNFAKLHPDGQELILGKVVSWLNYDAIKWLVGSFNIHNQSKSPDKITAPALLSIPNLFADVVRDLAGDLEAQAAFLNDRFIEILKTKDVQMRRFMMNDEFVLNCLMILTPQQYTEALCNAAENDHYEVVGMFLMSPRGVVRADRERAVISAATGGCLSVLRLLKSLGPISMQTLGNAVDHAAEKGYLAIVRELLNIGAISNEDRGNALASAALNGHLAVVQLLDSVDVLEGWRGSAVMNAAQYGHLAIIQFLLKRTITINNRGIALQLAARGGHYDVVCELNDWDILEVDIENGLKIAVERGHLNIVNVLRGTALKYAAKDGRLGEVLELLKHNTFSKQVLKKVVDYAVGENRGEVVRELLKRVEFTEEEYGMVVEGAAISGHIDLVRELLAYRPIGELERGFALRSAAGQGYADIVRLLLDSGPISRGIDISLGLRIATRNGHHEVVKELSKQ
jgi:ankyrin repeat protein